MKAQSEGRTKVQIMIDVYLLGIDINLRANTEATIDRSEYSRNIDDFRSLLSVTNYYLLKFVVVPRFNSEYLWNIVELTRIGATQLDYHTKEQWFSQK